MDILKIINGDYNGLSEEEIKYAEDFSEKLKEKLIDELVKNECNEYIEKYKKDKEIFIDSLSNLLMNGVKGYKKMNIQLLLNIYLDKKGEEDFIKLISSL